MEYRKPSSAANRIHRIMESSVAEEDLFPVNVEKIALELTPGFNDDPVTKVQGENLKGFEGALIPISGKSEWGILYNTNITIPGRVRFTLAHELGHYLLHRSNVGKTGMNCSKDDMQKYDQSYAKIEAEANDFAATLLMPVKDFRRQIGTEPFSLALMEHCAERYEVSLTALLLHWVCFTSKKVILISSCDGFMKWARSSTSAFKSGKYFATKKYTVPVPEGTLSSNREGVRQAPGIWFQDEEVTEYCICSETHDMTLTVLLFDDIVKETIPEEAPEEDTFDISQLRF